MDKGKGKPKGKGALQTLHVMQHVLAVAAAVMILVVLTGSSVMMNGVDGNYSYSMKALPNGNKRTFRRR